MGRPAATGSDILDLIDGALADYGTSDDAMRWTSEPATVQLPAARRRRASGTQAGLVIEICALTGYDGYTADAIARHAEVYGPSSPYADIVGQAARNIVARGQAELATLIVARLKPVVQIVVTELTGFFAQLAASIRTAFGALVKLLPPAPSPPRPARPIRITVLRTAYRHRHRGNRRWR
jgi:hypothetical protein